MQPTTSLLTGGNGNLGRLVADKLLADGQRVVKFDLPGTEPASTVRDEHIVVGDVRDSALLKRVVEEFAPDRIYHFASLLSGSSEENPQAAWEINADASFQLLRIADEAGVAQFFFASTSVSYGGELPEPLPEGYEQWPENLYGATKVAVERLGHYFRTKRGLDFRCLRFPLVISPFAPRSAVTAYPSHAFRAAVKGEAFAFPVSPPTGMSTIFLDDVIDGIVQFTAASRERITAPAYNLHSYFVSAQQVAEEIRRTVPSFEFTFEPQPVVEHLMNAWPDVYVDETARRDWGWQPKFDFVRSAERMFEMLA